MSDHEFEKQVRQKLDDLRLKPSVESWQKIEDGIRHVRRRPAAVYWMPLLLLMLAAGGYFYFSNEKKVDFAIAEKKKGGLVVEKADDLSSKKNSEFSKKNNEIPATTTIESAKKNNDNLTQKDNPESSLSKKKSDLSVPEKKTNISLPEKNSDFSISNKKNQAPVNANYSNKENNSLNTKNNSNKNLITTTNAKTNSLSPNITLNTNSLSYFSKLQQPTGASLKKPLSKELFDMDNQLNLSPTVNLKPKNISKKWAIGVRASAGVTAVNEGNLLDINRATVEDVSYSAFQPNAAFAPRPQYTPSHLTPGFSFSAGVTFQRQLSRRVSLNTGLNYLQLNTKNKVGVKVYGNQVVNNGTRGYLNVYNYYMLEENGPTDYMNRYHYLELPVSVSIGLNNSRKLPIFFDAGIAYSRLLGSNSLHFDGTTGVYYKNDRLLNDNQFAFTTGFAFKLFNRTKYPILLGPSARYNVTRMLQKDVPGNKSFMTLGVDMKLFIW